jgi:hypothetical protein
VNRPEAAAPAPSICLLAGYFGRLPAYFDAYLRSCESNPSIQWIILTDDPVPRDLPPNVRLVSTTVADLQRSFSRRLGFEVCLSRAYLLCDFRPAFGLLFEEHFAGYDFWGHCDLDMIFGDLRQFLRPEILAGHDRILQRGHLSVFRNSEEVNRCFMQAAPGALDYREVLRDERYLGFDEWRGLYRIMRYLGRPQYHEEFIADIVGPTRWKIPRFEMTELPNHPRQVFYWYRGKVFQAYLNRELGIVDREVAYLHFQKRPLPAPEFNARLAEGFLITPDGFVPYAREHLSEEDFDRLNRGRFRPALAIGRDYVAGLRRRLARLTGGACSI